MNGLNTRVGEMEARLLPHVRRAALSIAELAETLGLSEKASVR
jgi:biotin operon repressor